MKTSTTNRLKTYYRLTKPGIIYGNLITASAGFLLASRHHFDGWLLLATLAGLSLVVASACVFNNYIDRGIDKKMARTKKRAIVAGLVSARSAIIYAVLIGTTGLAILAVFTNWLTFSLALTAEFFYVVIYGIAKRRSVHGTLVGSIPGAMPPVIGYVAVTNNLDFAAVILFMILVFWQMPHFYAIAMYRYADYKAAGLPVLPVKKGMRATRLQILAYIAAFTVAASLLSLFSYTGFLYLLITLALGVYWLGRGIISYHSLSDERWGKMMFLNSLIVTLGTSLIIALGPHLP